MNVNSNLQSFAVRTALMCGLAWCCADAQLGFDPPHALNSNAANTSFDDDSVTLATDGKGIWMAVWNSTDTLDGTVGSDLDILVSKSANNGVTWTTPIALNSNATTDTAHDFSPFVATDGNGLWIVGWNFVSSVGSDADLLVARSTNDGQTWSNPAPLNTNSSTDARNDFDCSFATDGNRNWVAVWMSLDSLGDTIGIDKDILFARSADNGKTWTAPAPLNTNAGNDSTADQFPTIETDGDGTWIAAWQSFGPSGGSGTTAVIKFARSTNNGATWTDPAALNTRGALNPPQDFEPSLVADGNGNWIAAWYTRDTLDGTIGEDTDIFVARSKNNGVTWTSPVPLNSDAAADSREDDTPGLATDSNGNWVAVWMTHESSPLFEPEMSVRVARSQNNGATWSTPVTLLNGEMDQGTGHPYLKTDKNGNWVTTWSSRRTFGFDNDILVASAIPPVVRTMQRASNNPTNARDVIYHVRFTEPVLGVDVSDFAAALGRTVTGAFVQSVKDQGNLIDYVVSINAGSGDGTIRLILFDNGTIRDDQNNKLGGLVPGNGRFSDEIFTIDRTKPGVSITSALPDPAPTSPIPVTVTFTEPVFGFIVSDIVAGNATVQNFAGSGASYSFNLAPTTQGTVTADIAAGVATDLAGNANSAATQFSRTFGGAPLTVTAPNGGEKLKRGRKFTITWTALGEVGPNVKVELLRNGALVLTIFNSTPNDGAQRWNIPANLPVGNGYAVRITDTSNAANTDTSDAVFRIRNP